MLLNYVEQLKLEEDGGVKCDRLYNIRLGRAGAKGIRQVTALDEARSTGSKKNVKMKSSTVYTLAVQNQNVDEMKRWRWGWG